MSKGSYTDKCVQNRVINVQIKPNIIPRIIPPNVTQKNLANARPTSVDSN
jgi:hypothetical protein